MNFTQIDPDSYEGVIPTGTELVVMEGGDQTGDTALLLYGFDEIGMYDSEFTNPIYGFISCSE